MKIKNKLLLSFTLMAAIKIKPMKKTSKLKLMMLFLLTALIFLSCSSQSDRLDKIISTLDERKHAFDVLEKRIDDIMWHEKVGDVAFIDKVRLTGPPRAVQTPTGTPFFDALLDNDLIFRAYIFFPRETKQKGSYPLIVFSHGGVHGTFSSLSHAHIVRELVSQGYIVVAPDYRGSTGYGGNFYRAIDYGGLENEDVLAATRYMIENYSMIDPSRVGLLGWSHGGMISLMNALLYPDMYACAYAGVPVSDLAYRISYQAPSYEKYFTAKYHIGCSPAEAPEEYARRSPVTYAHSLRVPVMITTAENDDDVGVNEVRRMIDSLKHYSKDFEYKIYGPMPGAHFFDRIDTREATDARYLAYKFLERYLKPEKPFASPAEMRKAGYMFN